MNMALHNNNTPDYPYYEFSPLFALIETYYDHPMYTLTTLFIQKKESLFPYSKSCPLSNSYQLFHINCSPPISTGSV